MIAATCCWWRRAAQAVSSWSPMPVTSPARWLSTSCNTIQGERRRKVSNPSAAVAAHG